MSGNETTAKTSAVSEMIRTLVGCKWSLQIFRSILGGTNRPGSLTRAHPGLTTKVLNQCLRNHLAYGILVIF